MTTRALIFACSSSQRRSSSSSRSLRSARACSYVEKRPGCTQTVLPPRLGSRVAMRVATRSSSSRSWLTNSTVFGRLDEPRLEPALGGHVEVVVGLVEDEHLVGSAQQRLEHDALLLPAGQRRHLAPLGPLERRAEGGDGADVPERLPLVAADVAPVGERLRVVELVLLGLALHHRELGAVDLEGRPANPVGRDRDEQVAHRAVVADLADELPHHAQATAAGHGAVGCREVTGQDPQQRGLAGAVGADERDLGALAHPEGDVAQQASPVRQGEAHGVDVEVAHESPVSPTRATNSPEIPAAASRLSAGRS